MPSSPLMPPISTISVVGETSLGAEGSIPQLSKLWGMGALRMGNGGLWGVPTAPWCHGGDGRTSQTRALVLPPAFLPKHRELSHQKSR